MHFPDEKLAKQVERHFAVDAMLLAQTFSRISPEEEATALPVAGGYTTFFSAQLPINRAIGVGLTDAVQRHDLEQVETFYRSRNQPVEIEVSPFTQPSLLSILKERHYHVHHFYSVYAHYVETVPLATAPSDITVKQVDRSEEAHIWASIAMNNEPTEIDTSNKWYALGLAGFRRPSSTLFMAYVQDQPVGTAAMCLRDRIASLSFASTRAAFRNRGVQQALIHARLQAAQVAGCDLIITTTVPGNNSMRNLIRAGFEIAYTKMVIQYL